MKIPAIVQKEVDESKIDPTLHFVEIISIYRGEPCLRLYAYKHTKTYGKQCKEVGRRFVDRDLLSGSLYYTRLGGYQVIFAGKKRVCYTTLEEDNHFYEIDNRSSIQYPNRYFKKLYINKDVEAKFKGADEWLDYLVVPDLRLINDTMDFIRAYREHPSLEKLVKGGFGYLWDDKIIYRLGSQKHNQLITFLRNNKEYVIKNMPNYGWISKAITMNMNACEYEFLEKTQELSHKITFKYNPETINEMWKYIQKQSSDIDTYCDYITACKKLRKNIYERGVMFPRNLAESHDQVTLLLDEKENSKTNIGLRKVFEILTPQIEQTGEFQLVLPRQQHDLVCWGNELHCCVGTMGYGAKMAKGETIILGVFLNGKIIECCQIGIDYNNEMQVLQLRGDHNLDSPYHNEAEQLTNNFLANYKNQKLIGACI